MIYQRSPLKNNFNLLTVKKVFLLLLISIAVMGCNGNIQPKLSDEEQVMIRAQERLDLLLAGEFYRAWEYATPSYRQRTRASGYITEVAGAGMWTGGSVISASCQELSCEVLLRVEVKLPRGMDVATGLTERWIKIDDQWWIHHR